MSSIFSLLKYVIAGTMITGTFIAFTILAYLHIVHEGLTEEIMLTLMDGQWPEKPSDEEPVEPEFTAVDSLALEFAKLDSQRVEIYAYRDSLLRKEQTLETERLKIDTESRRLLTIRDQIDSLNNESRKQNDERIAQVSKLVEAMKPTESVPIMENLTDKMIVRMLFQMKEQPAADILSGLEPDRAARITRIMGTMAMSTR